MLTRFDDFCIHQTTEPLSQPHTSDRNFYDRYWFNGFDREGAFIFEAGFGIYPNRHVMDGHFSVSMGGVQHAFHTSRRAPLDRTQTQSGPFTVEVIAPMQQIRLHLAPNETGIECDLLFHARTAPVREDKNLMNEGVRTIMNTTRFTQFGHWHGYFSVNGTRTLVNRNTTFGTRDKSWGWRPVGESEAGAPGLLNGEPGVYWVWAPIHFDDHCTHYCTFQDRDGKPTQESGSVIPVYGNGMGLPEGEDANIQHLSSHAHRIQWEPGTRRAQRATVTLGDDTIELTPLIDFQMLAIGYQHPEWGHGVWKGEQVIASESWKLDELDKLDYKHIHRHQVVHAKKGNQIGVGTLETVCFGRHTPSGFQSILDGAPCDQS